MPKGIYLITNKLTKQNYVGQGLNVIIRMGRNHKSKSSLIYDGILEYGKENFDRRILIYCERNELNRLEIACIKIFHSHVSEGGYNKTWGGRASGMEGRKHSPETINKMSASAILRGNTRPPGYHHSKETIEKIRESNRKPHPTVNMKGSNNPTYGTHHTEEWKRNMHDLLVGENNVDFGKKYPNSSSKYHGVTKDDSGRELKIWRPYLRINGKGKHLTRCKTEEEAARAYDKYVVGHNLPHLLNFPEEWGREK